VSDNIDQSQIPPLGEGYAHSRKAYGLVSALLIAWELIGVELEASPIENIKSLSKIQVANTISSSSSQFFIVGFTLAQPVITFLFLPISYVDGERRNSKPLSLFSLHSSA
jgi:hypothetical protein